MRKTVFITILFYFIMALIHNLGHPITPDFLRGLNIEDYMFGTFFALMSLGLVLGGPFWGILGDRFEKKYLMLIGMIVYSIGQYVFGNVHNIIVMSIFRFVSGFGVSASVTLLMSYLIQKSDQTNQKRNVAYGLAAMAFGASVSYYIGGKLPNYLNTVSHIESGEVIFLIQALLNLLFGLSLVLFLEKCEKSKEHNPTFIESIKDIRNLDKDLLLFLVSLTFVSIGAINVSKYLEVYIADIGRGSEGIGDFVFITGIVGIFTTAFVVPQIVKLKRDVFIMLVGNILSAVIVFSVFQFDNVMLSLYTLFMTYVVIKAAYAPLETSFISSYAQEHEIGKMMGIRQFFFAIGFVVGPLLGGFIYGINKIYVFYFSVLMFLIAAFLIYIMKRRNKELD